MSESEHMRGRVTIPTDVDVVPETLELLRRWGADAIRDCDGTDYPEELKSVDAKVYSTYYTTRKDNAWAKANPDEVQQCYIIHRLQDRFGRAAEHRAHAGHQPRADAGQHPRRHQALVGGHGPHPGRAAGQPPPGAMRRRPAASSSHEPAAFHDYTVSFLAYLIWDPVHMYNAVTNGWTNFEHQITFDVRQPKTHKFTMERLRKFIAEHPYVNVIRYTTFFHQFTLVFDELKREKYVDWYGYSASVSPYILEQFEREVGYKFRPEYIIDQGYYNNQYRVPSKEFKDFMAFQRREVAKLAKEMVDITHELGKEAMMFLGDHWIGTEPYMDEFKTIGLDAVVGSVGNGSTLRLISRHSRREVYRGALPPLLLPRHLPRGRRPRARGQGELGDRPPRHSPQAHRPHRLRRVPQARLRVPRVPGLCADPSATSSASSTRTSRARRPTASRPWRCSTPGARPVPGAATWCTTRSIRSRITATPASSRRSPARRST